MRLIRFLILGLALASGLAGAQTYPDKTRPIRLVVPNGAGTSVDQLGRALARGMSDVAGVNVVVENRPGGEGAIAIQAIKNAPADGYTLLLTSSSTTVLNVHLVPNLSYDPLVDLVPVRGVSNVALALNVGPSVSAKTAREFIAAAKASPGKLTFGNGTTTTRLAGELLEREAAVKLLSVPYKNLADAMQALAAGQIDSVFIDPVSAGAYYKLGVRALAVTGSSRLSTMPDVPTLKEEGLPNYELTAWYGTFFGKGVRPDIVTAMQEIVRKAAQTPAVTQVLTTFAMGPLELSGDALGAMQRADIEKWGKLIKAPK